MTFKNQLYYGDNLNILREYIKADSVDLLYLDPPFKSGKDYNVLFDERNGTQSKAQIKAFEDTWTWDQSAAEAYQEVVEGVHQNVSKAMQAFRTFLGESDMMAYLSMMALRLIELRRVLKPTGSIYLHCDPTASHYLKMLLDSIFGPKNFRNEIIWYYYNKMHDRRKKLFPNANDTIFFYVKDYTSDFVFHQLKEMRTAPVKQLARKKVGGRMVNVKDADGHVVYRMKADRIIDNVWRLPCLQPAASERLGYPTQKPESVLERIILASSNEGDIVFDPFCGCGTAIVAAQKLKRYWIGIDITCLAIALIKNRLQDTFGEKIRDSYTVVGEPVSLSEGETLAKEDPYQFQWWALSLVDARPVEQKKGADKGIDGRKFFYEGKGETKQIILSVKAGHVTVSHIRDLRGVLEREKAQIGVLITMEEPTKPMRTEAASAGFYSTPWGKKYPTIQILTIQEILNGKPIDYPRIEGVDVTFKKAKRKEVGKAETPELDFEEDI